MSSQALYWGPGLWRADGMLAGIACGFLCILGRTVALTAEGQVSGRDLRDV
jgi:hypothetical protein